MALLFIFVLVLNLAVHSLYQLPAIPVVIFIVIINLLILNFIFICLQRFGRVSIMRSHPSTHPQGPRGRMLLLRRCEATSPQHRTSTACSCSWGPYGRSHLCCLYVTIMNILPTSRLCVQSVRRLHERQPPHGIHCSPCSDPTGREL